MIFTPPLEIVLIVRHTDADSIRHGGTCPPTLLQMAVHGGTVSRKTANKKLTKPYILTITKALTKTATCSLYRAKKSGRAQFFFWRFAPHFQIRSGATG